MLCLAVGLSAGVACAAAWAQSAPADFGATGDDNPRPLGADTAATAASDPIGVVGQSDPAPGDPTVLSAGTTAANGDAVGGAARDPTQQASPLIGKPKPKQPKLYRPNPKTSPPLAALVPYRGAPGLPRGTLNPLPPPPDGVDPRQPAPTIAVIASPDRARRPVLEDDPYAPVGVAAGTLRLFPFVETSGGYDSNPNQTATGVKPSAALRANGGLDIRSDFSSNSLTASLRGGYSDYPGNTLANRPDASGVVDGRIDVTRDDKINLEARFGLATQTPGSPLLAVPGSVFITNRPSIISEGATLGGTHAFNRLSVGLRGTADRLQYGDATQSDGTKVLYSLENYNDFGLIARADYEVTPALIPFAEVDADKRVRDNAIDQSGYARDSIGVTAKAGSTFEFSRLLTGTASAGYIRRRYDDARLRPLSGPAIDGSLVYTVTPLTKATVTASTVAAETTLAGASGALSRSISLELAHTLFRNFTISGTGTFQVNQYQGVSVNETFTQGVLKGTYSINREFQVFGTATRQVFSSSLQGSSYKDNIFLLGMRVQR